jgi:hypothetical protein
MYAGNLISVLLFQTVEKMANINLLFSCPHGGKNDDGTITSPPYNKQRRDTFS